MAVTYDYSMPVQGGGFGNYRVAVFTLTGTYAQNGFSIGLDNEPDFLVADSGYTAVYSSGKVVLKAPTYVSGTTPSVAVNEVSAGTTVTGVKILAIFKGDY